MTPDKFNTIVETILTAFRATGLKPEPGLFRTPTGACALGVLAPAETSPEDIAPVAYSKLETVSYSMMAGIAAGFNKTLPVGFQSDHTAWIQDNTPGVFGSRLVRDNFRIGVEIGSVVWDRAVAQYEAANKPVKYAPGVVVRAR